METLVTLTKSLRILHMYNGTKPRVTSAYISHSQDGWSPLMLAAHEGHTEVITQLIGAGANTDLQSTKVQMKSTERKLFVHIK